MLSGTALVPSKSRVRASEPQNVFSNPRTHILSLRFFLSSMNRYIVRTDPAPPPPTKSPAHHASYLASRDAKRLSQAPAARSAVLSGCVFYFTNCLSHSQLALTRLVHEAGGRVSASWARKRVTHVVSDRLCAGKLGKELRGPGRPNAWSGAVVRPVWIVDSLEEGKKVSVADYLLLQKKDRGVQSVFKQRKVTQRLAVAREKKEADS